MGLRRGNFCKSSPARPQNFWGFGDFRVGLQPVFNPLVVVGAAGELGQEVGGGELGGEVGGGDAVAQGFEGVVGGFDGGGEGEVALEGDADAVLTEPVQIGEFAAGAAEEDGDADFAADGGDFVAGLGAGKEHGIDAGVLVGFGAFDGFGDAAEAEGATAAGDDQGGVLAAGEGGFHFADAFVDGDEVAFAGVAVGQGQGGILDGEGGDAGGFEFFDGAADVEGVAVAVVGVDHQAEVAGAADAVDLLGEFGEGEDDEVGGTKDGAGGDGAGEHSDFEAQVRGGPGGDGVEDGCRVDTAVAGQDSAVAFAACGEVHQKAPL